MDPGTEEQDRSDMARLGSGQDAALDALMSRHAERLFNYLLRVLQNEVEAADIAQESFVRVYLNRAKFRPSNKFSTWLYAIATNLARDLQRRRSRHPHVSLDAESGHGADSIQNVLPDQQPGPAETLDSAERSETVRIALNRLPDELRLPLLLSVYEDKSHSEISVILKCSAKAVEMRLYRARHQLREMLEKNLTVS
jgi:RNA polymerase sigma-70 factor, ECF subfamily